MLAMDVEVGFRDRIGLQHAVGAALRASRIALLPDPAVDYEMRDMDVLGLQLARHALREAAQAELAHCEGRRLRIALDARRGTREQDRAVAALQHLARRGLAHQEPAVA